MSPKVETGDFERGRELYHLRRYGEALPFLQQSVAIDPDSAERWCWLSLCLSHANLAQESKQAAERAIQLDPSWDWPHRLHAFALSVLGDSKAASSSREAIRNAPHNAYTRAQASFAATRLGNPEEGLRQGEEAVRLDPGSGIGWAALGWAQIDLGRFEEAEQTYLIALRLDPNEAGWHNNYGVALLSLGRYEDAARAFCSALELEPTNEYGDRNLARAVGMGGDLDEAARIHRHASENRLRRQEEALRLSPGDSVARAARAGILAEFGRLDEALVESEEAVHSDPDNALVLSWHALILERSGKVREAKTVRLKAARLDPGHAGHTLDLARLYLELGMPRECRAAANRLAKSHASSAVKVEAAGYAEAAAGNWTAAESLLSEAVRLSPLDCCTYAWLGVARLERGDRAGAEWCLRRIKAVYPGCRTQDVLTGRLR